MQKLLTSLMGIALIGLGVLALAGDLLLSALGVHLYGWEFWRLWPLFVVAAGLLLVLPPILSPRNRGLGALFIPGMPVLITGGILLVSSLFHWWNLWGLLWPLEVLSLAAGFILAAIFTHVVWFGLPAILIGLNGLVLAFCTLTGLWSWWAVLWTVEPLAVGLCLLLVALATRSMVVGVVSSVFCGFAGVAFFGMTALLSFAGLFLQLAGPVFVILSGIVLLVASFMPRRPPVVQS